MKRNTWIRWTLAGLFAAAVFPAWAGSELGNAKGDCDRTRDQLKDGSCGLCTQDGGTRSRQRQGKRDGSGEGWNGTKGQQVRDGSCKGR